jgi:hydroxymethylbilane synthase
MRVQKVLDGKYDAIVLAHAGLKRLGLQAHISEVFPLQIMLPAPGQGALAVQCRADDSGTLELLSSIHDPIIAAAVQAERAFLFSLGVGYSLPVAAFAEKNNGSIILTGAVMSADGKQTIRLSAVDKDPYKLGERLAQLVIERGAMELLKIGV